MSGFTRARNTETGAEGIVPVDGLPNLPYWEAFGEPADNPAVLQVQIDQEKADAEEAAQAKAEEAGQVVEDGATVADVLDAVGDDPTAAAAALEAEKAKPAKQQRKTLVDALTKVVAQTDPPEDQAASPAETPKD